MNRHLEDTALNHPVLGACEIIAVYIYAFGTPLAGLLRRAPDNTLWVGMWFDRVVSPATEGRPGELGIVDPHEMWVLWRVGEPPHGLGLTFGQTLVDSPEIYLARWDLDPKDLRGPSVAKDLKNGTLTRLTADQARRYYITEHFYQKVITEDGEEIDAQVEVAARQREVDELNG